MAKGQRRQPDNKGPIHWGGTPDPEFNDEIPVEIPFGACRPQPLEAVIANMVRSHVETERNDGFESFEEAEDFEEENDELLDMSPYELPEVEPDVSGYEVQPAPTPPEEPPEPSEGDTEGEPPAAPEEP